jgi:hypothetical protein
MMISRSCFLRTTNVSDKSILYSINCSRKSCRVGGNVEKYGRDGQATDDNLVRNVRLACWLTKVTNIHSEYLLPVAFMRRYWLHDYA